METLHENRLIARVLSFLYKNENTYVTKPYTKTQKIRKYD